MSILRTYENDKVIIPDDMDKNFSKYDIGEEIMGEIGYTVEKKDAKEITLCINSFSCRPQPRAKNEDDEEKEY